MCYAGLKSDVTFYCHGSDNHVKRYAGLDCSEIL